MNFYETAQKLSNIKRYLGVKLFQEENVAEHSFYVSLLSLAFVEEYNLHNPKDKISVEEVLKKAILHDLEEGIMGDVPSPVKNQPGFREIYIKEAKKIMKERILKGLPLPILTNWFSLWVEDKDEESGEIIKLADKLQAYLTTKREVELGNKAMDSILKEIEGQLNNDQYQALFSKYPLAKKFYNSKEAGALSKAA